MADTLYVTPVYAAALALVFVVASVRVIAMRRTLRIGIGTGGDSTLERRARVHANFAEYVPLALILLLVAELREAPGIGLHVAGMTLLVGRIVHAASVSRAATDGAGRVFGMVATMTAILLAAALMFVP